jgi:hypothetical protein
MIDDDYTYVGWFQLSSLALGQPRRRPVHISSHLELFSSSSSFSSSFSSSSSRACKSILFLMFMARTKLSSVSPKRFWSIELSLV